MDRQTTADLLEKTPAILRGLMAEVPEKLLKEHRIPGKWSAHEHACHISRVQMIQIGRLKRFLTEERPVFAPYVPGTTSPADELIKMDLRVALDDFEASRAEFVAGMRGAKDWEKTGEHPEYTRFSLAFMARHVLFHDYVHMYRIEELGFTRILPHK
ncbi:MAG: DinB family protein [Nitrospinae bacterium]|nr:DinB family protein [Nitrospinota bacterium]